MPVVSNSSFKPERYLRHRHLQTCYRTIVGARAVINYRRERINTPDGDFLDLDWSKAGSDQLAIISHGLEGSSSAAYVLAMVRDLNAAGIDCLAWNFRGCSGEPNRTLAWYHSGKSEDLQCIMQHIFATEHYSKISMIGFSVGGNITLKLLAESGSSIPAVISCAVAISTPCDLRGCAETLERRENTVYMKRFLKFLRHKIELKQKHYPNDLCLKGFDSISTFREFDNRYTAPLNGFLSADDYWEAASSLPVLNNIQVPALLLNAVDDPFLSENSYPAHIADTHAYLHLETPAFGGHVGFVERPYGCSWLSTRVLKFIRTESPLISVL